MTNLPTPRFNFLRWVLSPDAEEDIKQQVGGQHLEFCALELEAGATAFIDEVNVCLKKWEPIATKWTYPEPSRTKQSLEKLGDRMIRVPRGQAILLHESLSKMMGDPPPYCDFVAKWVSGAIDLVDENPLQHLPIELVLVSEFIWVFDRTFNEKVTSSPNGVFCKILHTIIVDVTDLSPESSLRSLERLIQKCLKLAKEDPNGEWMRQFLPDWISYD
jgi:hypothetical protein